MYTSYNANPDGNNVGDCVIRAISTALGQSWDRTFRDICLVGRIMRNMPSGNSVWQEYLDLRGWRRFDGGNVTVREFCREFPHGTYVLGLDGHVVCVKDGELLDTWDSGECEILYVWER
jgi:hypothetical protein